MTTAQDELRSCLTKRLYFNQEEAQEEADRALSDDGIDIGEPYPCRYCPWWHTGRWATARPRYEQRSVGKSPPLLVHR